MNLLVKLAVIMLAVCGVAAAEDKWPYKFLKTKTDDKGNVMDLFAYSGELDPAELKKFFGGRKQKSTAERFYYVVIFNEEKNAAFPKSPFTAEFGIEEETLKNIRAIYVFNKHNGFSEFRFHKENVWDHLVRREKVP